MFASHLDTGIEIAAKTYRALQPVLKDVAPSVEKRATATSSSAKSDYNELRRRALDANDVVSTVGTQLRRKVPELGL